MRPLRALLVYLAAIFIGGALLAPWVWHAFQAGGPLLADAAHKPFQRFVTNCFLFIALLGLPPFFRNLGANSLRDIGLTNAVQYSGNLFKGLLLGLVSLAPVIVLVIAFDGRGWREDLTAARVAGKLASAVFTAAGVAFLEEVLFRGAVMGGLRRMFDWRFALIVSALIYAAGHFLEDVSFQGVVHWYSGLQLLPRMWGGFLNAHAVFPGFFNLTLAGLLLGLAFQRTGNLYFSMGIHAGWIFWLAVYRLFTITLPKTSLWFWGTEKMIDGWLAFLVLSLTLAIYASLPMPRKEGSYA